jgi:hypothetical protein
MNKLSFAPLDFKAEKKWTKRAGFLAETPVVLPWGLSGALIEPRYPTVRLKGFRPFIAAQAPPIERAGLNGPRYSQRLIWRTRQESNL